MPRASSEEAADIVLDDPEGGTNQGFREAKEVRWRGAAKLGRETSRAAERHLAKNLPKKLPAECTPINAIDHRSSHAAAQSLKQIDPPGVVEKPTDWKNLQSLIS